MCLSRHPGLSNTLSVRAQNNGGNKSSLFEIDKGTETVFPINTSGAYLETLASRGGWVALKSPSGPRAFLAVWLSTRGPTLSGGAARLFMKHPGWRCATATDGQTITALLKRAPLGDRGAKWRSSGIGRLSWPFKWQRPSSWCESRELKLECSRSHAEITVTLNTGNCRCGPLDILRANIVVTIVIVLYCVSTLAPPFLFSGFYHLKCCALT